jgi:lysophospholipase L1-like esterase
VLDLWCGLRPGRLGRLLFALQPVPDWFGRPLGTRERTLAAESEAHRPESWRRTRGTLAERAPAFRAELLRLLAARDVPVVDLNTAPRLLAVPWVFIDRYHLTDDGQCAVAEVLAEAVKKG